MIISPEFHRQLWRFNPWTLILGFAMMAFLFYGVLSPTWGNKDDLDLATALTIASVNMFGAIIIVGVSWRAGTAFAEDANDRTWDFQRMSSISPWDMVFGRYCGATVGWWVVGFAVLIFGLFCQAWMVHERAKAGLPDDGAMIEIYTAPRVIYALLIGLLLSFSAYYTGMQEIFLMRHSVMIKSNGASMGIAPVFFYGFFVLEAYDKRAPWGFSFIKIPEAEYVDWWGRIFDGYTFWAYSLVFFIFWMIAAIYRMVKVELRFRCTAVVWVTFNLCLAAYVAGFFSGVWAALAGTLTLMVLALVAATMFDVPGYEARIVAAWRGRQWKRVFENVPGGICSLFMATGAYAVFMTYALVTEQAGQSWAGYTVATFATTGMLLVLRDTLFVMALSKARVQKKITEFSVSTYYVGLYGALPLIFIAIDGWKMKSIEGLHELLSLLIHALMAWPVTSLLPQVLVAALLLVYAVRRRRKA